tara:strand:- start:2 stop:583 length:582 start_codon:yes stop_codon:yes gene_type:complete
MAIEPIPSNFLTDTIRFLLRWGLRLMLLLVAIFFVLIAVGFTYSKYKAWNEGEVILVALKCGPSNSDDPGAAPELFISLKGTRKSKIISKSVQMMSKSSVTGDEYSNQSEGLGFEYDPADLLTTRDKYIDETTYNDGSKLRVSFNRKTLRRTYSTTIGDVQETTFRECKEISVKDYKAELESVEKAFSEGNKI